MAQSGCLVTFLCLILFTNPERSCHRRAADTRLPFCHLLPDIGIEPIEPTEETIMKPYLASALAFALLTLAPAIPAHAEELTTEQAAVLAEHAKEEKNKALVTTAYQELFGAKDLSALDRYFREDYIQHNPTVPTGREALRQVLLSLGFDKAPKSSVDFVRVAAEGDLVWLHTRAMWAGAESVIVDIFRVEDGKIAEHWDVIQPIPAKSANTNGMY
jgi:predicted SnoaL-like aldol condensation-catalyzing enzyme